jgi:hypothetical protein
VAYKEAEDMLVVDFERIVGLVADFERIVGLVVDFEVEFGSLEITVKGSSCWMKIWFYTKKCPHANHMHSNQSK